MTCESKWEPTDGTSRIRRVRELSILAYAAASIINTAETPDEAELLREHFDSVLTGEVEAAAFNLEASRGLIAAFSSMVAPEAQA